MTKAASPSLSVALRRPWPPAGKARVTNDGVRPIKLWRRGSSWGDVTLRFRIDETEVELSPQVYTRNLPADVVIDPGANLDIDFDLGAESWKPWPLDPGRQLVAVYEILPSPEAQRMGVWTGRVESDPILLRDLDSI